MAARGAEQPNLSQISDLENLVLALIGSDRTYKQGAISYQVKPPGSNDMLLSKQPIELQLLPGGLVRVGTVGDGNCMLHSIMFAASPSYRTLIKQSRTKIVDQFRNVLITRMSELRALADSIYSSVGGATAFDESFDILLEKREEINLELGQLIAHLYGLNFLAIQFSETFEIRPVRQTLIGMNPSLPTILVNYIGGGLDIGNTVEFQENGHYEAIISTPLECSTNATNLVNISNSKKGAKKGAKQGTRKKSKICKISINEERTKFMFHESDPEFREILTLF